MDYIIKDKKLVLQHSPGKGAWTYHLVIPNTKNITGTWGHIKVAGKIDHYEFEMKNLAPMKDSDKRLSVNETIRKAINKTGGDTVTVTLYKVSDNKIVNESEILDCLRDEGVLKNYEALKKEEQKEIIDQILTQPDEDSQIAKILAYIKKLKEE